MIWLLNELNWVVLLFVFSLVSIVSIGYFKFGNNSFTGSAQFVDYLKSIASVKKLTTKVSEYCTAEQTNNGQDKLTNSVDKKNSQEYSTFKMSSFARKQSFIKRSLDERKRQTDHDQHHEPFTYSSLFAFTKTLINRTPKSMATKRTVTQKEDELANSPPLNHSPNISNEILHFPNSSNHSNRVARTNFSVKGTMSTMHTMTALNEKDQLSPVESNMNKSVSLQIIDEMKVMPKNRLLHQSSSSGSSSHSSTPADLFSLAEKGRIGANQFRHKAMINNNKVYQEPAYTELVTQISNHEDAINREYLLHQLNPSQYHGMHYSRRLERQNCLVENHASHVTTKRLNNKITKQDTVQSNSSTQKNSELEHLTSSSSNGSCSECGSLDTEEEHTIPFMKKPGHYHPNVTLRTRARRPLKLSSSLEKSNISNTINLTKQCSSDSNDAMVGLLNENFIKRQLSNGTYLKLKNDRLNDKRIFGRRLTNQNSFSAGSSFNNSMNSSNNSSFDHDDMLIQFTSHQANSFSSTDDYHFHHNQCENNSIHSNDTSSSSNSSCGNRHAERIKFGALNLCDSNQLTHINQLNQSDLIEQGEYDQTNMLHVSHAFDPTSKKLKIRIIKTEYVPMKLNSECDRCYIKVILLPNKRQKFKTTIKQCNSTSPVEFDEQFTFNRISPENIISYSIKYVLFLGTNESKYRNIGEAIIRFKDRKPMQQEDNLIVHLTPVNVKSLIPSNSMKKCNYNVISKTHPNNKLNTANNESLSDVSSICRSDSAQSHHSIQLNPNLPELLIGLAYNAVTGGLQVSIIRGSQFKAKSNKPPDTYVKCTLLSSNGREIGRNKTTVKRSQPNPVYKQTFAFQVALFQLPDVSLMISVYNKKSMNRKKLIGWFSLGCSSTGEEDSHWNEMRDSKGEQICRWHILTNS